ncbi:hypothetical protein WN943_003822 [Citrus x changshan-huyou]
MVFTLAGSASIPLSLTMKAKSLLEDSPTRGLKGRLQKLQDHAEKVEKPQALVHLTSLQERRQ